MGLINQQDVAIGEVIEARTDICGPRGLAGVHEMQGTAILNGNSMGKGRSLNF
jgi:hypothetical protein